MSDDLSMFSPKNKLSEGDYYLSDQGYIVFTAQYLQKRGYCCQNGCKHCPYGFKKAGLKK